tara:strand:+ start:4908 stop:6155 length:1248 start_codon:yes stop_codon:yes gene_type:complete
MSITDHHIGFSLFLKLIIKIFGFENIYIICGILNLGIFFLIGYILSKENNYSLEVIIVQILVLMSPVVVDYIYKPKQFFVDFCIAIYLVNYFAENKNIKTRKVLPLLFFSVLLSNILIIYFFVPLLKLINKSKNKLLIFSTLLITIPFFYTAYNKFLSKNFREYWSSYYETSSESFVKLFFNNLMFFRNFNDLGLLPLIMLIVLIGLTILYKDNKNIFWMVITPIIVLNLLNLLNLYPIGAGRTDLILFPFFVFCIIYFVKFLSRKINIIYLLVAVIPIFVIVENNKVREDNTLTLIENTYMYDFDLLYISYYSIPQTILFDSEYGQFKKVENECFYNSVNTKVVFMQSDICRPQIDFSIIENEILNNKKILIIGHESKTQNIEDTVKNMKIPDNDIAIEYFGTNELMILVNFNN